MAKHLIFLILFTGILINPAHTQNPATNITVPHLGGHQFMPSNYVRDPFIKTYVRNSLGIGKALDVKIPLVVIDGNELIALTGDILFLNLDFEYHQRVKDWLGVWGRFKVLGRLGSNTTALLSEGVTAVSGFDLGWLIKLHQTKNTQLSGSLGLTNSQSTIVNILDFINGIIDGDFSSNNKLVNNIPALRGELGLRYAWALNDLFGTYLLGELSYGQSSVERNAGKFYYGLGGVLDFDLSTRTVFPFGVAVGALHNSLPRSGEKTKKSSQSIFVRIGYNAQTDFIISLETSMDFLPLSDTDKTLQAGLTTINLRYYFQ